MADFSIISSQNGEVLYSGAPRYIGAYLRPGYLEFQEVASPEPIPWRVGDYIYYPRTAATYRLYFRPKVTKKATALQYGGSFVYENVQLFDDTKQFDICPFSDIVPGDNRIHFSTQDTFSFFGTPYDVRDRIAACLEDMYPGEWIVRVASGLPSELTEEKDFSASGLTVLGALDRTYELWPGLGWTHTVENGKNVLIIGGANVRTQANTTDAYRYGLGLTRLTRSVGNADELTTRLYGYGSMRNMPAGYYKNKPIRDAQSVDIEHLMIPISAWGLTNGLPDPSKAYVEDADALAKYGLIPRKVYFDGSDSRYPEIFPSIEGLTAGRVRSIKSSLGESNYVPSSVKWPDSARVDALVTGTSLTDDGNAAPEGKKYVETSDESVNVEETVIITRDSVNIEPAVVVLEYTPTHDEDCTAQITSKAQGSISLEAGTYAPDVHAYLCFKDPAGQELLGFADVSASVRLTQTAQGEWSFTIPRLSAKYEAADGIWLVLGVTRGEVLGYGTDGTPSFTVTMRGTVTVNVASDLVETFTVMIPQIGFNIEEQAAIGEGMTVSMKTGMCAARDFKIESCVYDSSADAWILTLWRSYDEDLGTWFPNSNFQLASGDRFVLLDIAMPELYILAQSERLLEEIQDLLDDACEEKPFYEPEVNSKYVNDNLLLLREGMYMHLVSDEIVDGGEDYALIDTLEIDEAASNIPVYSLKLRMRKATGWTTATGASSSRQSSSVEALGYIDSLVRESRRLAQRTFLSAKETAQMLIDAALEGYTEQISPIAIRTMHLLVGDQSLQFKFWADSACTLQIDPVHYNASTKQVTFDNAYLQHMTLGIDAITTASGRELSDYLIWVMTGRTTTALAEPGQGYYLYAKCDALNDGSSHNTGSYVIDSNSHQMYEEEEEGGETHAYYYFLIGILNSEIDEDRSYAPLYGFTEVLPGQITTDLIRSSNGLTWLDLAANQFQFSSAGRSFTWNLNNDGRLSVTGKDAILFAQVARIQNLIVDRLLTTDPNNEDRNPIKIENDLIQIFNSLNQVKIKITSGELPVSQSAGGTFTFGSYTLPIASSGPGDLEGHVEQTLQVATTIGGQSYGGIRVTAENNVVSLPGLTAALSYLTTGVSGRLAVTYSLLVGDSVVCMGYLTSVNNGGSITNDSASYAAKGITLPVGTHTVKLVIDYTGSVAGAMNGSFAFGPTSSSGATGNTISYPEDYTMVAVNGAQFRYANEGIRMTSGGSKVIQGGNDYNLVGGGTLNPTGQGAIPAPKRIMVCDDYPNQMEDDVLYIKVSASS